MSDDRKSDTTASASVNEQAASWWITLDAPQATPADHDAFREWVVRSPERIEAVLETARLNRLLMSRHARWPDTPVDVLAREVRETGADVEFLFESAAPAEIFPSLPKGSKPAKRHFRQSTLLFAAAASIVGILAGVWLTLNQAQRYATGIGEQRSVALQDGSIVILNTASRIEVKFDQQHRRIRLLTGEALFQVARDTSRPFDVEAGDTAVRAVGTQFNVHRRLGKTVVTVVEGKVAVVSDTGMSSADVQMDASLRVPSRDTRKIYLSAGEQLTVDGARPVYTTKPVDMTSVTAWTQRRLIFDHRPIAEVAEEFNRYNALQIEIVGAELRNEEMTAVFRANDPGSFLDFVSKMSGVRVMRSDARVRVSTAP